MSTKLRNMLLGLGVFALLVGCAQTPDQTTTPPAEDEIVVGVLYPLSGEAAALGIPGQRVMQMAEKEINNAGGIKGKKLKLVFEDGACDPDVANRAMNSLVNLKKVKVVIGGFCSSETLNAAPIAERNKVVLFSPGSSSPDITKAGDFVFRNYPSDLGQGQSLADYASKKGYKKVGLIVEEQPYTEGIAIAFTDAFNALKGEVVMEKYAKDASDFRTQITKLQAAKVNAFFVDPQTPAKAGIIVKQLKEAGVKGPFLMNDVAFGAVKEVIEPYGDYIEGSVGAEVPYDKTNARMKKLQTEYKTAYKEDLSYLSYMATTFDAVYIVKEALEKVGEDAVKIKDYLYTVKGRRGLAGTLSFDANGDPDKSYRHAPRIIKKGKVEDYR